MISNRESVKRAQECAQDLLGTSNVSLEEIELGNLNGKAVWSITLGFPPNAEIPLGRILAFDKIQLKQFFIDAETGEFVAMKLRELAARSAFRKLTSGQVF